MILKKIKDNIRFKHQKANKGYCDEDLYSIKDWFIDIFPKMLQEFAENTIGYPADEDDLRKEVKKMDKEWLSSAYLEVIKIRREHTKIFNLKDGKSCWLLILLRMKYCFEMCNEFNVIYDVYREQSHYEDMNTRILAYKKEAFYLFDKYFFDLWW